jgi:Group II intron, maturase-specific domain
VKPYLQVVTSVGRKKVCWWEGDIAPYGFEGLVLNLGNGLVKAGQVDAAKVMYANAKYAGNYATWPYEYYGRYTPSALYPLLRHINRTLIAWAMRKFKRYRDVLEMIATSDLNARAAQYAADANPKNAPPLSVPNRSCVYCHATVPEPGAN